MQSVHRRMIAWAAAACAAVTASASTAATWNVCQSGCTHSTVQGAVDAAASGDRIVIAPGRYVGNITITGKELTITGSTKDASQVQLIGAGVGPVLTLGANTGGPYYDEFIEYVTVTGGSHLRGTAQGGGIQVRQGATLLLFNSNVIGNTAAAGGGVSVNTPGGRLSEIQLNCLVASNTAYIGGGVYLAANSSLSLSDECVVSNNTASGNAALPAGGLGGGVYAEAGSQLILSQPIITNNSATAPAVCDKRPSCASAGGGAYILGQVNIVAADITSNNVYNNSGSARGGGLYLAVSPAQLISGNVIAHNSVYSGVSPATGGGIFASSNDPEVSWTLDSDAIVFNNAGTNDPSAPPAAGGVQNVGKLVLTNGTNMTGNFPTQCLGGTGCPAN